MEGLYTAYVWWNELPILLCTARSYSDCQTSWQILGRYKGQLEAAFNVAR